MMKALPNTSFLPVPKSAPAGHTTAAAHLLWQVFPRYPCLEYKDNSGQSCPVRYTWTASFGRGLMFWQKWFNLTPQFVAYQFPGHLLHPHWYFTAYSSICQVLLGALKLMPRVLEAVSEPALRAYADVIPIQRDIKDIHIITQAWYTISSDQRSRVIQTVSLTLCKRWEEYLKIEKGTGHFHNTLVLTAYVNVILDALVAVYSTSAAYQARIIQKATALEQDLNGWFESSTQQRTCFFVDLTDLYLLLRLYPPEQFSLDSAFARAIKHTQWLLRRYNYLWEDDDMNFEKTNALLEQFSSKMKIRLPDTRRKLHHILLGTWVPQTRSV